MKKTYIAPTVNVYEIKAKSILMTSSTETINTSTSSPSWTSGDADSRGFSFGDEE